MEKVQHRTVPVNGLQMHVAELGEGPLVLFIHGFPELWYSWRHQMAFMAARGYREAAPDMRGYGDTTGAPLEDPSKFTVMHLVGDLVTLLDAIAPNEDKVFVVGHDWGAYVAWHLCMYRPDRVKALVALSVPFSPRNPEMNAVDSFRKLYGDDHYICRFQEPGDIEAEFETVGTKEVLKNLLSFRDPVPFFFPKSKGFTYSIDRAPWLKEEDLDYYVSKFEKTGFSGGVNYYRALGLNWELNAPWSGAGVTVPSKFVTGEFDLVYHIHGTKDFIHKGGLKKFVPLLEDVVVLEGAAHFVNQERPDEINEHIYDLLRSFRERSFRGLAEVSTHLIQQSPPTAEERERQQQEKMEKIQHKTLPVNGLQMHVAELGEGPLVLFLHGFPEFWYSWRHQMAFMAARGYRAAAPDMRGYGDTTGAPLEDPSKFTQIHLVGDLIALLDAIAPNEDKVFVVGHDWGAYVAWHLCMYRPDRVKAMVALSVPFSPRNPAMNAVDSFRKLYGDDHYVCRFQEPGDIEAEFEKVGTKEVLKNFLSFRDPVPFYFPKSKGFTYSIDKAPWLKEEDLDYYVSKFEKTGFTGGVNYYRALGFDWELNAPWTGAGVTVPSKFVTGEFDLVYHVHGTKDFIHKGGLKKFVPLLEDVVVLEGAAHFVNQERPDEINEHIYDFIKKF